MMDPLWSETCWSTFKYFIILIVSTYYILCIGWVIKCLIFIDARCKHEDWRGWTFVDSGRNGKREIWEARSSSLDVSEPSQHLLGGRKNLGKPVSRWPVVQNSMYVPTSGQKRWKYIKVTQKWVPTRYIGSYDWMGTYTAYRELWLNGYLHGI